MKYVLLLDTETTGLDDSAVCIEVAAARYSVDSATVVQCYSSIIAPPPGTVNGAERVNGITYEMMGAGDSALVVWNMIDDMAGDVDAIVAHGAEFDRRFAALSGPAIPWICSLNDLLWPLATKPRESLVSLSLAHGLGVLSSHRALDDVMLLARLLTRVRELGTDLTLLLARGLRPKGHYVVADQSYDPVRNDLVRAHGFSWNEPWAHRKWSRIMAIEDAASLPFATIRLGVDE